MVGKALPTKANLRRCILGAQPQTSRRFPGTRSRLLACDLDHFLSILPVDTFRDKFADWLYGRIGTSGSDIARLQRLSRFIASPTCVSKSLRVGYKV